MHKLILFLVFMAYIIAIHNTLILQWAYATERYERKSISCLDQVLKVYGAKQIPSDKASELLMIVKDQINIPRFDANYLPESLQTQFWEEVRKYLSENMQNLESIKTSIVQVERSLEESRKAKAWEQITLLYGQLEELQKRQKREEEALFVQAAKLLTDTIAPFIFNILSDPQLLEIRAQKLVNETELNRFIVRKARESGVTSDDLRKVMNSAYIYMIFLTDYSRILTQDGENTKVTYSLDGGIAWFKLVPTKECIQIQFFENVMATGVGVNHLYPKTISKNDAAAFKWAIEEFATRLYRKVCKMDCFNLKTGIIAVNGVEVVFPLGHQDGIFIDQEYRVYEESENGKDKKKGFFYVYRIEDECGYGKLVIRGAEPGMQIREQPYVGTDITIRYSTISEMKIWRGNIQTSKDSIKIKTDVKIPLQVWNLTFQRDAFFRKRTNNTKLFLFGRRLYLPQLFWTVGLDLGLYNRKSSSVLTSDMAIDSQHNSINRLSTGSYMGVSVGTLKKWHVFDRIAVCFETLIQYQDISVDEKNNKLDKEKSIENQMISLESRMVSFLPRLSIEFVIHERLNVGVSMNSAFPLGPTQWKNATGPIVICPANTIGFYTNFRL